MNPREHNHPPRGEQGPPASSACSAVAPRVSWYVVYVTEPCVRRLPVSVTWSQDYMPVTLAAGQLATALEETRNARYRRLIESRTSPSKVIVRM